MVFVALGGELLLASNLIICHRLETTSEFIRGTTGGKTSIYNDIVKKELHNFLETNKTNVARPQLL